MANNNFISSETLFAWGSSFNTTKKIPVIAKRVWQTYEDMFNYVSDANDTCIAGIVLTVVNDEDVTKNGAYFVVSCPTLEEPTIIPAVKKIGSDEGISEDINDIKTLLGDDSSGLVKDVEDIKITKADASTVYTKEEAEAKYVAKEGYVAYTQDEKDKLAGLANIKSVGDNLNVDASGKLTVTIPEVEVPFQSVATEDKVLKLENGVLSSTLSFGVDNEAREDGKKYLYVRGINDEEIGKVDTTDFIVDGMLNNVEPIDGSAGWYRFTFNVDKDGNNTNDTIDVDFSEFIDVYAADNTTIELKDINGVKTFNVKANVFDAYGAAAQALVDAKSYVDGSVATINDAIDTKVAQSDYNIKVGEIDGSISNINAELAEKAVASEVSAALELKANIADVYTSTKVDELLNTKVAQSDYNAKVGEIDGSISNINAELANKVNVVEGSSLVSDELITKLDNLANITSVEGDLTLNNGALSVDLTNYVQKDGNKVLSTNDFTNELKSKLEGIASDAEVNVVKSVVTSDELKLSDGGELSLNLGAFAKTSEVNNGLATKLDATAKVNGVSFEDGEVTIDAGDIALESAITRGEELVYDVNSSIQAVLAGLSARIDSLDPNISGEFGVSSVSAGSGIEVTGAASNPIIGVKVSTVEGNIVELKTDGVYVADMRSYWEAI